MTTFLFVRHGETDWNREMRLQGTRDIPLNDEGRSQARRLAKGWRFGGEVLVSSPLSRARETAEILAASLGFSHVGIDPRLVERGYGVCEGMTVAERKDRYPDGQIPGLEAPASIEGRALDFLNSLTQEHPGRTIVVVSHGGFINVILSLVSDGDVGTGKTFLGNASVSRVDYTATGWNVVTVGATIEVAPLGLRE